MLYYDNERYGILQTGVDPNLAIDGSLDTGVFPYGWGEVYGIYWNTGANQSFGVAKHDFSHQVPPSGFGDLYWTDSSLVDLKFNKITYYDSGIDKYLYDENGTLGNSGQAIISVSISSILPGMVDIEKQALGFPTGFFLTTQRFLNLGSFGDVNAFFNSFSLTAPKFTGFIAYRSGSGSQEFDGGGDFGSYLNSGTLTVPIERSEFFLKPFFPAIVADILPITTDLKIPCWRVTGFFSSFSDRLGNPSKMIEISPPSSKYCIFFSGYDGAEPIFLTYINGATQNNCAFSFGAMESTDPYRFDASISETSNLAKFGFSFNEDTSLYRITANIVETNDLQKFSMPITEKNDIQKWSMPVVEKGNLIRFAAKIYEFNH